MNNQPEAHALPVHSMPEATTLNLTWDVSHSSSIASLVVTVSDYMNIVHVTYKSNPSVRYLYTVNQADVFYIIGLFSTTDSFGTTVGLVKKVATKVSKHVDGAVTLLSVSPMPLKEALVDA